MSALPRTLLTAVILAGPILLGAPGATAAASTSGPAVAAAAPGVLFGLQRGGRYGGRGGGGYGAGRSGESSSGAGWAKPLKQQKKSKKSIKLARRPAPIRQNPESLAGAKPLISQETGQVGTERPSAFDRRVTDRPLSPDDGAPPARELLALTGAPGGGFSAVWSDSRDGLPGLYFARLDGSGELLEPERPLYSTTSLARREAEPDVALFADGSGLLAWSSGRRGDDPAVRLRRFDALAALLPPVQILGLGLSRSAPRARSRSAGSRSRGARGPAQGRRASPKAGPAEAARPTGLPRQPHCATLPGGVAVATWIQQGRVCVQEVAAGGGLAGRMQVVNPKRSTRAVRSHVTSNPSGGLVVGWSDVGGIQLWARSGSRTRRESGGPGALLDLAADGFSGGAGWEPLGWWLLVEDGGQIVLRHLGPALGVDREDVPVAPSASARASLAVWSFGPAVLIQGRPDVPESGGGLYLRLMTPAGAPLGDGLLPVASPRSNPRSGLIASNGGSLLVAWTERTAGGRELRTRLVLPSRGAPLGEVRTLGSPEPGSDQIHPAVDAGEGIDDRAVAVWIDGGGAASRVRARVLRSDGDFATDPIEVPVPISGDDPEPGPAARPAVAVADDGAFLVAWIERDATGAWRARGQAFESDGRPHSRAFDLAEGADGTASDEHPPAVEALRSGRGWAIAWTPAEGGLRLQHVSRTGAPSRVFHIVRSSGSAASPDVCVLDDNRVVVAWDEIGADDVRRIHARLYTPDLRPDGLPVTFDLMFRGYDRAPAVAPGPRAGFVATWVSGQADVGDVFVRGFDREGLPASEPRPVTTLAAGQSAPSIERLTDGSWVLAWQDDLRGHEEIHLRRLLPDVRRLGPIYALHQRAPSTNVSRWGPDVAALGTRVVGVWTDPRRARGADAYFCVLGARFDDPAAGSADPGSVDPGSTELGR